jgi:hypothetical protein
MADSGLTEEHLLVLLEIERALQERNPESALTKLGEALCKAVDRRFKLLLLRRRFQCCTRLNRFEEAKKAAQDLLDLEPANFYMSLSECSLLDNRVDRVARLEQLKGQHPYSSPVLNALAQEVAEALEKHDALKSAPKQEDVEIYLRRSIDVEPEVLPNV